MQKKIIALAIVAAFSAPAFADTNVYGVVDAAVVRASGDGVQGGIQAVSGGLATSRLGVKHTEVLDGGLTAVVVVEYKLDTETNSSILAARQQMLALAGDFGTVATGYLQTAGYDFGSKYDVLAGSTLSPLQDITNGQLFTIGAVAGASRAPRALAYISPNMGGLVVAVNYTTSFKGDLGNVASANTAAAGGTTATLLSVNYETGPFSVGAVLLNTVNDAAGNNGGLTAANNALLAAPLAGSAANVKEYALGASYDLGVAKIKATYQDLTMPNIGFSYDNKVYSVGVAAPVGPGTVVASYAKSSIGLDTTGNSDASGYGVAYLQGMSKTTTAYVGYSATTQGTAINGVSVLNDAMGGNITTATPSQMKLGGGSSVIAFGLNKKF